MWRFPYTKEQAKTSTSSIMPNDENDFWKTIWKTFKCISITFSHITLINFFTYNIEFMENELITIESALLFSTIFAFNCIYETKTLSDITMVVLFMNNILCLFFVTFIMLLSSVWFSSNSLTFNGENHSFTYFYKMGLIFWK